MDIGNRRGRRVPGAARRVAVAAGLVAGLAAPALAVLPAHADTTVTVSGVVTDASTGKPLSGICVSPPWAVCGDGELSAADGTFSLSVPVGDGVDSIELSALPREDDPFHAPLNLTATRAGSWKVKAALPGLASVTGRVLDWATGEPVKGMCPHTEEYDGRRECSDEDGVWSITRLTPTAAALITLNGDGHQDTYVPGGSKKASARRFALQANVLTKAPDTLVRADAKVIWGVEDGWSRLIAVRVGKGGSDLAPARQDWEWTSWADGLNPAWSVEPGTYRLGFYVGNDDLCGDDDGDVCPDQPVLWYPGTFDPGAAKAVQLRSGTTLRWNHPEPEFRKPLMINVTGVTFGTRVEANFFFASGEMLQVSQSFGTVAATDGIATIKADTLPPAPLKVQLVIHTSLTTTQTVWYRGTSVTNAKPVPAAADSISIKVPAP